MRDRGIGEPLEASAGGSQLAATARNATGSRRAARKVRHFQLAGRPNGIPFSSGQTKTDRTPKTSKTWLSECLRTWHARKPACHRPANPRRSAHPRHIPGGLGSLVRLGQGASPAKRPQRLPRPPARATQLDIGNIGNWQHLHIGNIPRLPCAAKMAAFPVKLRAQALTGTAAFQAAAYPATNPQTKGAACAAPLMRAIGLRLWLCPSDLLGVVDQHLVEASRRIHALRQVERQRRARRQDRRGRVAHRIERRAPLDRVVEARRRRERNRAVFNRLDDLARIGIGAGKLLSG